MIQQIIKYKKFNTLQKFYFFLIYFIKIFDKYIYNFLFKMFVIIFKMYIFKPLFQKNQKNLFNCLIDK